jgi:hypothetical protein
MELDNLLWKETDHISIKKLWEYLCTYCYLPRLANETVLHKAIATGLNSSEYFAYASGYDGSRYLDLKLNQPVADIERSGYLVKISAAKKQIADDLAKRTAEALANAAANGVRIPVSALNPSGDHSSPSVGKLASIDIPIPSVQPPAPSPKNTRFFMSSSLDTTRINRQVQNIVEEIIRHLTSSGATVEVSLEIEAKKEDGFSQQTVRTISENCRTLHVNDSGFDE